MLTKQDYETIAEIIREWLPTTGTSIPSGTPEEIYGENETTIKKLADYFAQDNPRFDRKQFLTACGLFDTS